MKDEINRYLPEDEAIMSLSVSDMFADHLLQAVMNCVQDGICFLSPKLDVLYTNPAMQFWYDIGESSIGKKCYQAYHGRDEQCEDCPAVKSMQTNHPEMAVKCYEQNYEENGWQRVFCMPLMDKEEGPLLVIEYIRDITNEVEVEEMTQLKKAQIDTLMNLIQQKQNEREEKQQMFVNKMNRSIDVVLRYLNKILDGDSYEIIKNQLLVSNNGIEEKDMDYSRVLTEQETLIAQYIVRGFVSKEIADKLHVSKKTIDHHRTIIRKKLNLKQSENLRLALKKYLEKTDN